MSTEVSKLRIQIKDLEETLVRIRFSASYIAAAYDNAAANPATVFEALERIRKELNVALSGYDAKEKQ